MTLDHNWRSLAELLIRWGEEEDANPSLYDGEVEWANALAKWLTSHGVSVGAALEASREDSEGECRCHVRLAAIQYFSDAPGWLQNDPQRTERGAILQHAIAQSCPCGEAGPPPPHKLREAAVFANREIDAIRLGVLARYPSGRLDLCPLESRCYEVRSLMSAVIRATEDLRRETGMLDGAPNIMPPPRETEGRQAERDNDPSGGQTR